MSDYDFCNNIGRRASLGSPTPAKELWSCSPVDGAFVEITITHPETVSWNKMTSSKQKLKLSEIFRLAISAIPLTHHEKSERYFEYSNHGAIHLHGYLRISDSLRIYPVGVISDITKSLLSHMPKKYSRFVSAHLYGEYCRYKSPQCVVQYRDYTDDVRIAQWQDYCKKLQ